MNLSINIEVSEGTGRNKIAYPIETDLDGAITLRDFFDFERTAKVSIAKQVLQEEISRGFPKNPLRLVDNSPNKIEEQVVPFGKIEYLAPIVAAEAILYIYENILRKSIVDTGTYIEKHVVFLNKKLVATDMGSLRTFATTTAFKDTDVIRFINLTPYARKLELSGGRISNRGGVDSKEYKNRKRLIKKKGIEAKIPSGAYALTQKLAKGRFKGLTNTLKFGFISGAVLQDFVPQNRPTGGKFGTVFSNNPKYRSGQAGRPYVYPAIVLKFREGGIQDFTL